MAVLLTALGTSWPEREFRLEDDDWARAVRFLKRNQLVDEETLRKLEHSPSGVRIPEKIAIELGFHLLRRFGPPAPAPTSSAEWGPIATLNGVWIDPALAVQNARREQANKDLLYVTRFVGFFLYGQGFSVS